MSNIYTYFLFTNIFQLYEFLTTTKTRSERESMSRQFLSLWESRQERMLNMAQCRHGTPCPLGLHGDPRCSPMPGLHLTVTQHKTSPLLEEWRGKPLERGDAEELKLTSMSLGSEIPKIQKPRDRPGFTASGLVWRLLAASLRNFPKGSGQLKPLLTYHEV